MTKASWLGQCVSLGVFFMAGCSAEPPPVTQVGTGGAVGAGGSTGGAASVSGGAASVSGGTVSVSGGTGGSAGSGPATGGKASAAGGSSGTPIGGSASGGSPATGGATAGSATGGSAAGRGGTANASTGGASSGGQSATGGQFASGGSAGSSGGSPGAAGATSTACPSNGWTAGNRKLTLTHGGVERAYEIHVPASYNGSKAVPLMLVIHGAHNTPAMARSWSKMDAVSDANGFIIAYPAGLDCWNTGGILPGCTAADDDLGFIKAVVSDVQSHACIDPKRVYATGISNGAMMAQYLGCQAANIFAAVGGVAGPTGRCTPSRPISVFYVHGTEDKTVGYSSAQPNVTGWANRNTCGSTPAETYNQGSTKCVTYSGCSQGAEVEFCTVTGMGHCWPEDSNCGPGGGAQFGVTDFKASPRMWEFFQRYPLP